MFSWSCLFGTSEEGGSKPDLCSVEAILLDYCTVNIVKT